MFAAIPPMGVNVVAAEVVVVAVVVIPAFTAAILSRAASSDFGV